MQPVLNTLSEPFAHVLTRTSLSRKLHRDIYKSQQVRCWYLTPGSSDMHNFTFI